MRSTRYENRRLRMMAAMCFGGSLLDVGAAQLPNPFLRGERVVGVDIADPSHVPANYSCFVKGDVGALVDAVNGERFDTVLCGELIEHVERPYDLLRTLSVVIAPGGRLVLSTPNAVGLPVVLAEWIRSSRFFYDADHAFYFTPRWMVRMLERSGYAVIATRPVGLWLPFGVVPFCPVSLSYQLVYVAQPRTAGEE